MMIKVMALEPEKFNNVYISTTTNVNLMTMLNEKSGGHVSIQLLVEHDDLYKD